MLVTNMTLYKPVKIIIKNLILEINILFCYRVNSSWIEDNKLGFMDNFGYKWWTKRSWFLVWCIIWVIFYVNCLNLWKVAYY